MSFILITPDKVEKALLVEALKDLGAPLICHDNLEQIKNIETGSVLLVAIKNNPDEALYKIAKLHPVFILTQNELKKLDDFEDIFLKPLRLGYVAQTIKEFFLHQKTHQALSPIHLGDILINPKDAMILYHDKSVRLTDKELDILLFLSKHNDTAANKQALLDNVWEYASNVETHTLETHIYRLRQKLIKSLDLKDFLVTYEDGYLLKF